MNIFFSVTQYPAHSRLGTGHVVLRHSIPHFPPNFGGRILLSGGMEILNILFPQVGIGAQVCDCKRDRLWNRFPFERMKYLIFSFRSVTQTNAAWSSATEHAMPLEFGVKCRIEMSD